MRTMIFAGLRASGGNRPDSFDDPFPGHMDTVVQIDSGTTVAGYKMQFVSSPDVGQGVQIRDSVFFRQLLDLDSIAVLYRRIKPFR